MESGMLRGLRSALRARWVQRDSERAGHGSVGADNRCRKSLLAPPQVRARVSVMVRRSEGVQGWRRLGLAAVKTVHTIAFFGIGSCLGYLAYSGLARRSDRRGGGLRGSSHLRGQWFRCPLTGLTERLGSEHASVADIYLPRWLESHLPQITGPVFAGALVLHARNLIESRRERSPDVTGPAT
jgi:hypothetical protein